MHLHLISHIEIAFRLRIRYQAAYRRNRVTRRAEDATEISGSPGFDGRRRAERELSRLAYGVFHVHQVKKQKGLDSDLCTEHHRSCPTQRIRSNPVVPNITVDPSARPAAWLRLGCPDCTSAISMQSRCDIAAGEPIALRGHFVLWYARPGCYLLS